MNISQTVASAALYAWFGKSYPSTVAGLSAWMQMNSFTYSNRVFGISVYGNIVGTVGTKVLDVELFDPTGTMQPMFGFSLPATVAGNFELRGRFNAQSLNQQLFSAEFISANYANNQYYNGSRSIAMTGFKAPVQGAVEGILNGAGDTMTIYAVEPWTQG